MVKSILLTVLILAIQSLNCQEIEPSNTQSNKEMYDFHYEKHKKQKKTGFILLGSGVAATLAGVLIGSNSDSWSDEANLGSGAILVTAGALTTISSIPVFIVSGSNKRKAQAYVQSGQYQMIDLTLDNSSYLSIGLKIEF